MKEIPEKSQKRTRWVKAIGMGLGMIVIAWGSPLCADTSPGDPGGWFSSQTQPAHRMAPDLRNDGMNILLARGGGGGGGGGGKGGGSGQCDGTGSGQGKGKGNRYGAKDGTGTGERPRDGSGYGAGAGNNSDGGAGKNDGSGSKGNRSDEGNR